MEIQLIRNATLKLTYAGRTILVDPMISPKETFDPFVPGLARNPTVDLVMTPESVLENVEAVLVTHSHPDHFDQLTGELLPSEMPIFRTPADEKFFSKFAFVNVIEVDKSVHWQGIEIIRIAGQHGSGPILKYMGEVSGYILRAENHPTVYMISDSVWMEEVEKAIKEFEPDIIITNSGGGILPRFEKTPVIMNEKQTVLVAKAAPAAKIVAVHLESIDFCPVSRESLRNYASENGVLASQLLIPDDGEVMYF